MLARTVSQVLVSLVLLLAASCEDEDDGSYSAGSSAEGESCGGFAPPSCAQGLYCEYEDSSCAIADASGTCKAEPGRCDRRAPPVCGCDGQRYGNVCEAIAAGVHHLAVGECDGEGEAREPGGTVDSPDPA